MPLYAVQVETRREYRVCGAMQALLDASSVEGCRKTRCVVPYTEISKRVRGIWQTEPMPLFPGYVLVETDIPDQCDALFRAVPGFIRFVLLGEKLVPLARHEVERISIWIDQKDHLFRMSKGVLEEGGRAVVIEGPLRGHEGLIVKVNRHKRLAFLEMPFLGRLTVIKVGLEIVSGATS